MLVALTLLIAAAVLPNKTVAPLAKPLPAMVTTAPPETPPEDGVIDVTVGGEASMYVNAFGRTPVCPSRFMTTTLTWPGVLNEVVAVIVVALTTITFVAAAPPTKTEAGAVKPVPRIVTDVPPTAGPVAGVVEVTVSPCGALYVNPFDSVAVWLSGLVTTMSAAPSPCAPVLAVIVAEFTTTTNPAVTPPIVTVAPLTKPVPVSVTLSPPLAVPDAGRIVDSVGGDPSEPPTPNKSTPEGSLAFTSRIALLSPVEVGLNATWIVLLWPAPSDVPSGQFEMTNSVGFVPVCTQAGLVKVIGEELVFVIVMVFTADDPIWSPGAKPHRPAAQCVRSHNEP